MLHVGFWKTTTYNSSSKKSKQPSLLLENGKLNVALRDPISLGSVPVTKEGIIIGVMDHLYTMFCSDIICHWSATMHLLQNDDCRMVCVHQTLESS
jgi:hypothetical protein